MRESDELYYLNLALDYGTAPNKFRRSLLISKARWAEKMARRVRKEIREMGETA